MIIVAGEIRMHPGARASFFELVAPMVAATLREPGCSTYAFTPDPDDDDLIRLFEVWDSAESLASHFASEHMATWQLCRATLAMASSSLTKYHVSSTEPLG
jgi:quinol monooxygenase YgiN